MKYVCFSIFSNIKIIKNRAINDTTLRKMPYFCTDYNTKHRKEDEKNNTDDADAGMRNDYGHGPETCSDQV